MTIPVWAVLTLVLSGASVYISWFNLVKTAKQRDHANCWAAFWHDKWAEAHKELEELKKEAQDDPNSSPFPEGMTQAEYFGITSEKAEEAQNA